MTGVQTCALPISPEITVVFVAKSLSQRTSSLLADRLSGLLSIVARITSELWGPSPVATIGGRKDYVNFMDDLLALTWSYSYQLSTAHNRH